MKKRDVELLNYKAAEGLRKKIYHTGSLEDIPGVRVGPIDPGVSTAKQSGLVFGIPANDTLLDYWDRVEDRLFKIRNGMNIKGIRRELALFQPPIDPGLLVKAKAAGLSLEDVLTSLSEALPPYRFPYLIEKAKSVAGTVQSFGSALLSALEKKDVEELTLLRSVHEQNILKLTKAIKASQIEEATAQLENIKAAKVNVENRLEHYNCLIETGLTRHEQTQQISRHIGTGLRASEGVLRASAAIAYLVPQLGMPLCLNYGGKEIGDSLSSFASVSGSMAIVADAAAASAGLEATFQRREEEWDHQLTLVNQERLQMNKQIIAAEIRIAIAEKDLEIYEKNVEQTKEVYDFFKDKFTDLGLYDYLAVSLNRLYREAYNLAYDMAKLAERAYRFERDDDTLYIETDNWQADRAGLLSGERLLLQLQQMEKSFIEKNVRDYEINQSFSMRQINPGALIQLQETGMCDFFSIPEIVFDLFYPGQYKRRIKSVRMTIPCVTGPYTNVSCKLTLLKSEIRKDPETDTPGTDTKRIDVPYLKNTSVATSNANNDGGVFELNFRDERYMPFEGAGAISTWKLELPGVFRHFDYNSISDVIFHISYTAKDDGLFKETVETNLQGTLIDYAIDHDLIRLFSMKHEFSNELHRFLYPPTEEADQEITMTIDRKNFPYFLHDETISVQQVELIVKLKPGCDEFSGQIAISRGTDAPLDSEGIVLVPYSDPEDPDFADLYKATFEIPGEISDGDQWTLKVTDDRLDPEGVENIGLLFYYTISAE